MGDGLRRRWQGPKHGASLPGRVRVWGLGSGFSIVVLARGQGAWIPAGAGMTNGMAGKAKWDVERRATVRGMLEGRWLAKPYLPISASLLHFGRCMYIICLLTIY